MIVIFQDPDCDVQGLYENREYEFRVAATNANGTGDWLEMPNSIIAKMPFGRSWYIDFTTRTIAN